MPLNRKKKDKVLEEVTVNCLYLTFRPLPFLGGAADVILLVCISSPIYLHLVSVMITYVPRATWRHTTEGICCRLQAFHVLS
jgi:hypothetical protein